MPEATALVTSTNASLEEFWRQRMFHRNSIFLIQIYGYPFVGQMAQDWTRHPTRSKSEQPAMGHRGIIVEDNQFKLIFGHAKIRIVGREFYTTSQGFQGAVERYLHTTYFQSNEFEIHIRTLKTEIQLVIQKKRGRSMVTK